MAAQFHLCVDLFLLILQFESIEVWQKNQTSGDERMLTKRAMKELEKNHTNVRPWWKKKLTGPDGWSREVDAAAIADGCAVVVEHKNLMDKKGANQLLELVNEMEYVIGLPKFITICFSYKLFLIEISLTFLLFYPLSAVLIRTVAKVPCPTLVASASSVSLLAQLRPQTPITRK